MKLIDKIIADEKYREKLKTTIIDNSCPNDFDEKFEVCNNMYCECKHNCVNHWDTEVDECKHTNLETVVYYLCRDCGKLL